MRDPSKNAWPSWPAILLSVAVALLPALAGCGLVSFDVGQDVPPQTIMGSPIGALVPATLFSLPLNIDLSAETASRGTGPAKSANLTSLTLSVSSPAGGTFDFLTSITFSVTSPGDPSLPEVVIAKLQPVPGKAAISVPPTPGVDLLPYIKAGASIKASASGHQPSQDTVVTGKVVVTVHV
jgi:hypothetical protein